MSAHPAVRPTEDFRAGMAYAAHLMRHAIGSAHGGEPFAHVARIEPRRCCQEAIVAFAEGMAEGFEDGARMRMGDDHEHRGGGS